MSPSLIAHLFQQQSQVAPCVAAHRVAHWFDGMLGLLFPETSELRFSDPAAFQSHVDGLRSELETLLSCHMHRTGPDRQSHVAIRLFNALEYIKPMLDDDARAMFEGDPAANSITEVIRNYPGFYALAAHRLAHELLRLGVPQLPRSVSEHAHRVTGIDINPGATIGQHFCIDHGTGVVIGQTAVIGNRVKIYQGVTLGALSVNKEDASAKRHPTIEDDVVVYAGATILGGNTVVGRGSIIGGNVWLTRSVPPETKVYYSAKMTNEDGEVDTVIMKG
ncbi:MAG: serine O-acetyltransferase [Flavobacteriales bacterium]|nr:serine O-acetyltransferase [Flavobacteriales bacterium]